MKIGIITAMSSEQEQLANQLKNKSVQQVGPFTYTEGKIRENDIVLMQSGIGKVNASVGAVELINHFHPDCLVSTGVAGGIDPSLNAMEVVVSNRLVYHDVWCGEGNSYGQVQGLPAYFEANQNLYNAAIVLETNTPIHGGLICSGDQFITEDEQLKKIKSNFPDGLAVDMESTAIAQACYLFHVPFLSFRIISDVLGKATPNYDQYKNFWGEMADRSFRVTETFLYALPNKL